MWNRRYELDARRPARHSLVHCGSFHQIPSFGASKWFFIFLGLFAFNLFCWGHFCYFRYFEIRLLYILLCALVTESFLWLKYKLRVFSKIFFVNFPAFQYESTWLWLFTQAPASERVVTFFRSKYIIGLVL